MRLREWHAAARVELIKDYVRPSQSYAFSDLQQMWGIETSDLFSVTNAHVAENVFVWLFVDDVFHCCLVEIVLER